MRDCDIAARVRKEWSCVPCCDQLEAWEFAATTEAFEGFLYACRADAVGDIDYPGKFLEGGEERLRDGAIAIEYALQWVGGDMDSAEDWQEP
jgi:hypothetical protein